MPLPCSRLLRPSHTFDDVRALKSEPVRQFVCGRLAVRPPVMAQPMHMSFPMSGGHHLLPPLLPPHALVPDEILDDCTLFGGLQPLLPTPLQPPSGLPGLPAPGALPLPLSVEDDIFQCVAAAARLQWPLQRSAVALLPALALTQHGQGLGRGG